LINEALASGSAQFGILGDVPAIMAVASGLPVKILGEVGGGEKRNRLMVGVSSRAKGFLDLKRLRLGVTKGTSAHGAFFRLCSAHHVEPSAFTLIPLEPPDMPEALVTGQVDAVLVWEPTPTLIEAKGMGKELLSLAGYGNSFPMCVLGNTRFAKASPEETRKVFRALAKAVKFIEESPDEAAKLMASATGTPAPVIRKSMGFHYFTVRWVSTTLESLKQTTEFLLDEKKLRAAPDWNAVVDPTYLP
jgi:ABC-type nitrate/sulfonate/bicarbonate transport system substrate-binding protein